MRKSEAIVFFIVFIAIVILIATVHIEPPPGGNDSSAPQETAQATTVDRPWFTNARTPGCYEKEDWERITRIYVSGDKQAFNRLLSDYFAAGKCRLVMGDTYVYLESAGLISDPCVRPQGETKCLFVPRGVLEQRQD